MQIMCMYTHVCTYTYIYTYVHMYIYIYNPHMDILGSPRSPRDSPGFGGSLKRFLRIPEESHGFLKCPRGPFGVPGIP